MESLPYVKLLKISNVIEEVVEDPLCKPGFLPVRSVVSLRFCWADFCQLVLSFEGLVGVAFL
jgi:hypothetical protein